MLIKHICTSRFLALTKIVHITNFNNNNKNLYFMQKSELSTFQTNNNTIQ